MMIGWALSGILTISGALSDNPDDPEYYARTDARSYVISTSPWFNFPYPGKLSVVMILKIMFSVICL